MSSDDKNIKPKTPNKKFPDRDSNGHFLPGNRMSVGWKGLNKLNALKREMWESVKSDELKKLYENMLDLAYNADDIRVRLSATVYCKEWLVGRDAMKVELTGTQAQQQLNIINITNDEINLLKKLVDNNPPEQDTIIDVSST